jgi:diguanylate cyclase (GGDEF)-like protein
MECALQGWFHPQRISPTQIEALQSLLDAPGAFPDPAELRLPDEFPVHSALISLLCNLRMGEEEARSHWQAIGLHREELTWRLGRDPGVRVAALDHFVNREPLLLSPKVIEESSFERTARTAEADGMTGLLGERAFLAAVRAEARRAQRRAQEFAVALLDVDDFAALNGSRGRRVGDALLRELANLIRGRLRDMDLAARLQGGHFALLLPLTRRMGGFVAVDRIRAAVSESYLLPGLVGPAMSVTLSAGLAAFPEDGDSAARLFDQALLAVGRARESGGNRVVMRTPERRDQVRYRPMGLAGGVAADFAHGQRAGQVRIRDLSAAGALLEGLGPTRPGEVLELRLEGAVGERLLLEAQVVWEEAADETVWRRSAVRFLPRSGECRAALERWVDSLRRQGVE